MNTYTFKSDIFNILYSDICKMNKLVFIDENFNEPITEQIIKDIIRSNCKKIDFPNTFNQPIDNLPDDIIDLSLSVKFNQPINNLPINLKKLLLFGEFNQTIDNLPPNLETLVIVGNFNQEINNLPNNLKYISLPVNYNQNINMLPDSVEFIWLSYNYVTKIDNIPTNLKEIKIFASYPYLRNLKKIKKERKWQRNQKRVP